MNNKPVMPAAISLSEILAQRSRANPAQGSSLALPTNNTPDQPLQAQFTVNAKLQPQVDNFWRDKNISMPSGKTSIHLRLDSDVLHWFKGQGKGHLTRMNAVLRAYMEAKKV